jgi:uncharacterized membrane protein YdjX (TVP38/TMEM64 family)
MSSGDPTPSPNDVQLSVQELLNEQDEDDMVKAVIHKDGYPLKDDEAIPPPPIKCCPINKPCFKHHWRSILSFAVLVSLAAVLIGLQFLPDWVNKELQLLKWLRVHQAEGMVIVVLIYAFADTFFIPGRTLLALGVGFIYGFLIGFGLLFVASYIAAIAGFYIARLARPTVLAYLKMLWRKKWSDKKWDALMVLLGTQGVKTTIMIRLTPIPRTLTNYLSGLSPVRILPYLLGTAVHLFLSHMLVYIYLGSTASDLSAIASGKVDESSKVSLGLTLGLLGVSIIIGIYMYFKGKKFFARLGEEDKRTTTEISDRKVSEVAS